MLPDVELAELWRPCLLRVELEVEIEVVEEVPVLDDAWFDEAPASNEDDVATPRPPLLGLLATLVNRLA